MKNLRGLRLLFILFAVFQVIHSTAQDFQWVNFHQGASQDAMGAMVTDKAGNQYGGVEIQDSFYVGNNGFRAYSNRKNAVIFKQDKDGNVQWSQNIQCKQNMWVYRVAFNRAGNLLVMGRADDSLSFSGGGILPLGATGYYLYLAEFDTSGNYVSSRKLVHCSGTFGAMLDFCNDEQDNIYLVFTSGPGTLYDSANSYSISYNWLYTNHLVKFEESGKHLGWQTTIMNGFSPQDIEISQSKKVLLAGYRGYHSNAYTFAGTTVPNPTGTGLNNRLGLVLVFDSSGNENNFFSVLPGESNKSSAVLGMSVYDDNSVFLSGYSNGDSVKIGSKWKKLPIDTTIHFFGKFDYQGNSDWIRTADGYTMPANYTLEKTHYMGSFLDSFIYLSINQTGSATYSGQSFGGTGGNFLLKFDNLGNILWGFRTQGRVRGLGTDTMNGFYFGGTYSNSIQFGNYSSTSVGTGDVFVAKTYDYAIHRGDVSKGPYCAGDTIFIPYTKFGVFDTSNYFIAELSDEYGNYFGGQRELGRLKTTENDTIIGLLPIEYVPSSAQYRIRVRSTAPDAQSFYFRDSLRLLIYSRDSANPGPDIYLCKGDTVSIETFGGTAWDWSPTYHMQSPQNRATFVWPDTSTTYRIIISDSSGCGMPDTAYKKVIVRSPPQIALNLSDTVACTRNALVVEAALSGGDSSYSVGWYKFDAPNSPIGTHTPSSNTDTMSFWLNSGDTAGTLYMAIVTDSCSPETDTAFFILRTPEKLWLTGHFTDTISCRQQNLQLTTTASGGSGLYHYRWTKDAVSLLDTTSILSLPSPQNPAYFQAYLSDECLAEVDSAVFNVMVYEPLKTDLGNLTQSLTRVEFCQGASLSIINRADSFQTHPGRSYTWTINNIILGTDTSITLNADDLFRQFGSGQTDIQLDLITEFSNICEHVLDTLPVLIHPPLTIQSSADTLICPGQNSLIIHSSQGGDSSTYSYTYLIRNQAGWDPFNSGTADSFLFQSTFKAGQKENDTLQIKLSDACSVDSASTLVMISYPPPIQSSLSLTDSVFCSGQSFQIPASAQGGFNGDFNYVWKDSSGQTLDTGNILNHQISYIGSGGLYSTYLTLVVSDACPALNDTLFMNIYVRPELSLFLQTSGLDGIDSTFCFGQDIEINALPNGGKPSMYAIEWFRNDTLIHSGSKWIADSRDLHTLFGSQKQHYLAILKDQCSSVPDSVMFTLDILDPLNIWLSGADSLCFGEGFSLNRSITGGLPGAANYSWYLNSTLLSNDSALDFDQSLIQTYGNPGSLNSVRLGLDDGCSDTASLSTSFFLREPLNLLLQKDKVCADPLVLIRSGAQGGKPSNYTIRYRDTLNTLLGTGDTMIREPVHQEWIMVDLDDGCSLPVSDSILLHAVPEVDMRLSDSLACYPFDGEIAFDTDPGFPYTYFLKKNTVITDSAFMLPYKLHLPVGKHRYHLIIKGAGGCTRQVSLPEIEVFANPEAYFSWSPDQPDWNSNSIQLINESRGASSYQWKFPDGSGSIYFNPSFQINDSGWYHVQLTARNQKGCEDVHDTLIRVHEAFELFIPNAFTPNNDIHNPVFNPHVTGVIQYSIRIFDRWGEMIFYGDRENHWDGTYQGKPVPEGIYYYILDVKTIQGRLYFYNGSIVLIR